MPGFTQTNSDYETWLAGQCEVDRDGLKKKHERMRKDAFKFLRSTYFRWASVVEAKAPSLSSAPVALAVGDLHVENYGTWRDAEGRLVWGVNDFDEAARMPFAFDLLRLGVSASLAHAAPLSDSDIATAILEGYRKGLEQLRPTLVEENSPWLLAFVSCTERNCADFFQGIEGYEPFAPSPEISRLLRKSLPDGCGNPVYSTHQKGGGSLGRPRVFAVSPWRGGRVVREAKAWVPSALGLGA